MKIQDLLNSRVNNFTLMRFLAAMAVLYGHSYILSRGFSQPEDPLSEILIKYVGESLPSLAVDLFFVTSGFLICASYLKRGNLFSFIEARLLRIIPGLSVAVVFCIIIGSVVTTYGFKEYIFSPSTAAYFQKNVFLLKGVQFDLPGVFQSNPYPNSVNGSLWTLPIEMYMYSGVALLGSLALLKDDHTFNTVFLFFSAAYVYTTQMNYNVFFDSRTFSLGMLFLFGMFFYINRRRIVVGFVPLIVLFLISYIAKNSGIAIYLNYLIFSYSVILVALHPKLAMPPIDRWGDISYGLYIYAFPVQQVIAYCFNLNPLSMFFMSASITVLLATLSWRFVEMPAISLKGKMPFFFSLVSRRRSD